MPRINIVFDGGVHHGNPGPGYGSFAVWGEGRPPRIERREYCRHMTNNEAEYETLIAALQYVLRVCTETQRAPDQFDLVVRGDSQLVVRQYTGEYGVNQPHLLPYLQRARELGARFGQVDMRWQPRAQTVDLLGH